MDPTFTPLIDPGLLVPRLWPAVELNLTGEPRLLLLLLLALTDELEVNLEMSTPP